MILLNYCQNYIFKARSREHDKTIYNYAVKYIYSISTKRENKKLKIYFNI